MKLGIVILAAGNSRRFCKNKLLHKIGEQTMAERSMERIAEIEKKLGRASVFVVVVTQYEEISLMTKRYGWISCSNPAPERGISSSIRIGVEALPSVDGYLFQVCDQPWMTTETILSLISLYQKNPEGIVSVRYGEQTGNPCIFSKKYKEELCALTGDTGGKKILKAHMENVRFLPVLNPKELEDIDYPEGLQ